MESYEGPAILELMGHRRLIGNVTEVEQFGRSMVRIDFAVNGKATTQFYAPDSIYCLTPTTPEIVAAATNYIQPVERWELPQLEAPDENPTPDVPY